MTLDELKAKLDSFSPAKIAFVANVVDSLSRPSKAQIRSQGTWLTGVADWIEYFGLALSVHHAATTVPLGRTSFEAVFRNACSHVGWDTDPPGSATQRFVDVTVSTNPEIEPRRLSLKSTAAKDLSQSTAHISKLTEAAWIQDARSAADRRDHTLALFREYREAVTAILMLRAFRDDQDDIPTRYQLLEAPVSLFDPVQQARVGAFNAESTVIPCKDANGRVVARVALDRSDAKVTVRSILLAACTVHAEWMRN